ncbi:MAG TPA: cytochrome c [Acetobacteraceae bacterium]
MCHTAINSLGGSSDSAAFQGGLIPTQNWYAPSLTSNREAGLGDWSIADISGLLRDGVSHRGAVYGPMAEVVYNSLQHMTDADTRALSVYLKSLAEGSPPAPQPRVVRAEEGSLLMRLGRSVYDGQCASCHGAQGAGAPPHYPLLAGNQSIQMSSAVNPIRMVLNGGHPPGTAGNPMPHGMPPFAQTLSDDEVAAVVTYIRAAWGNPRCRRHRPPGKRAARGATGLEDTTINTEPSPSGPADDAAVDVVVRSGARGAAVLAGLATAIVIGLWLAFYLLVFVPRSVAL